MSAAPAAPPRKLLVTGVGGAPGFDLARALLRCGLDVIATDADPLAAGLHLPTTTALVPAATDPDFSAALLALCRDLRPDALLCTVESELPRCWRSAAS